MSKFYKLITRESSISDEVRVPEQGGDIVVYVHELCSSSVAELSPHYRFLADSEEQTQWEAVKLWTVAATSQKVLEDQEISAVKLAVALSESLGSPDKVVKVLKDALATLEIEAAYAATARAQLISLEPIRIIDDSAHLCASVYQAVCSFYHIDTTYGTLSTTLRVLAQVLNDEADGTLPRSSDGAKIVEHQFDPNMSEIEGDLFLGRVVCLQQYFKYADEKKQSEMDLVHTTSRKNQRNAFRALIQISHGKFSHVPKTLGAIQDAIELAMLLDASESCLHLLFRCEKEILAMEALSQVPVLNDDYFAWKSAATDDGSDNSVDQDSDDESGTSVQQYDIPLPYEWGVWPEDDESVSQNEDSSVLDDNSSDSGHNSLFSDGNSSDLNNNSLFWDDESSDSDHNSSFSEDDDSDSDSDSDSPRFVDILVPRSMFAQWLPPGLGTSTIQGTSATQPTTAPAQLDDSSENQKKIQIQNQSQNERLIIDWPSPSPLTPLLLLAGMIFGM